MASIIINATILVALGIFLVMVFLRFWRSYHPSLGFYANSERFKILVVLMTILSILITAYANVFYDHQNNFGKAISQSFTISGKYNLNNQIEEIEDKPEIVILCLDISGSLNSTVKKPDWIDESFTKKLSTKFSIKPELIPPNNSNLTKIDLCKFRAARILTDLNKDNAEFVVFTFGDNTMSIFPPTDETEITSRANIRYAIE